MQQSDLENTSGTDTPRREPILNLPRIIIAIAVVCTGIQLFRDYMLSPQADAYLLIEYGFISYRYSGETPFDLYALAGPVTYSFLHGGYAHLLLNMVWLAAFGGPLANRLGPLRFMELWVVTGLTAALAHYLVYPQSVIPVVGASGAISGMMGAASRYAFRSAVVNGKPMFIGTIQPIPALLRSRTTMVFLGAWFVINLATGLGFGSSPGDASIAWQAHIGGFVGGFFLINLFDPYHRKA